MTLTFSKLKHWSQRIYCYLHASQRFEANNTNEFIWGSNKLPQDGAPVRQRPRQAEMSGRGGEAAKHAAD